MAIASKGTMGTVNSTTADQSTLALTTATTALSIGDVAVLIVAVDNNQTTDGDEGAVSSVTDSGGNTWAKAVEFTNGQGSAQAGATVSIWWTKASTALATSSTITVHFTNNTSRDAAAASCWAYTVGAGNTLSVDGTNTVADDAATNPSSLDVTTANAARLRVRGVARESSDATNITPTTSWTTFTADVASTGTQITSMGVRGEFRIVTATNAASAPTGLSGGRDMASGYVAFSEVTGGGPVAVAAEIDGTATLTGTLKLAEALGATISPTATLSGPLKVARAIAATANATATLTGGLTVYKAGTVVYSLQVDWNNDGDFNDANEDITGDCVSVETFRGRQGLAILSHADPGRLVARLLNRTGKYSSFNSSGSLYHNLMAGRPVRLRMLIPYAKTLFTGYLTEIEPDVLQAGDVPMATLTAAGPTSLLAGQRNQSAPHVAAATGDLITMLCDDVSFSNSRSFNSGTVTTGPYAPGDKDVLSCIHDLEECEQGFFHEGTGADYLVWYEDRNYRSTGPSRATTVQATFSDAAGATLGYRRIQQVEQWADIYNEVYASYRNGLVTGALATLWEQNAVYPTTILALGGTVLYVASWPGPGDSSGLYVDAWTTPDGTTDIHYTGGTLSVTARKEATRMVFIVQNNSTNPLDTMTLSRVSARGTPVTYAQLSKTWSKNANSQADLGRRVLEWRAPFYANQVDAEAAASNLVTKFSTVWTTAQIELPANRSTALLEQAVTREISDMIAVTANTTAQLGMSAAEFWIEGIGHKIDEGGTRHVTTFYLSGQNGDVRVYATSAGDTTP